MTKTDELYILIKKFLDNKNKEEFLKSYMEWITSVYNELNTQGKTYDEISKEINDICFSVGKSITEPKQQTMLKDVLSSGLLQYVVGYKHGG